MAPCRLSRRCPPPPLCPIWLRLTRELYSWPAAGHDVPRCTSLIHSVHVRLVTTSQGLGGSQGLGPCHTPGQKRQPHARAHARTHACISRFLQEVVGGGVP